MFVFISHVNNYLSIFLHKFNSIYEYSPIKIMRDFRILYSSKNITLSTQKPNISIYIPTIVSINAQFLLHEKFFISPETFYFFTSKNQFFSIKFNRKN